MDHKKLSRRAFIRDTSFMTAAIIAGTLAGKAHSAAESSAAKQMDASKILNYHPKMGYRRLGKTGLVISEIGLGGHWMAPWREQSGDWWWGKFVREEVPEDVARNRTEVVSNKPIKSSRSICSWSNPDPIPLRC